MRNVSTALKEAVNAQQTGACFIYLITVDSDTLPAPLRVANDSFEILPIAGVRGVVSRGEEFVFAPFFLSMPNQDDTGIGRAQITIDNVSREIMQAVRSSTTKLRLKIEYVLSFNPNKVEVSLNNFVLTSIKYDALSITGDISVQFYDLEPYPSHRVTPNLYPAAF